MPKLNHELKLTIMQVFFDYPFALRRAIDFMAEKDKHSPEQGAVLRISESSLDIYHRNSKTKQVNILYISTDELSYFQLTGNAVSNIPTLDIRLDFISDIDRLTRIEELDENKGVEFAFNLERLKEIMKDARKTVKGCGWIRHDSYSPYIDIAMNVNSEVKSWVTTEQLRYINNDVERYDFSIYQGGGEGELKPHCLANIEELISIFEEYCRLKIAKLRIEICPRGLRFVPEISIDRTKIIGLVNPQEQSINVVQMDEEQIKAYKGLNTIARASVVKIYFCQQQQHSFLAFIFHVGYFGFMHAIYPVKA